MATYLQTNSASLEALPNEVKLIILQHLHNIESLKALVHASPAFHGLYRRTRGESFSQVLCNEFWLADNFPYMPDAECWNTSDSYRRILMQMGEPQPTLDEVDE